MKPWTAAEDAILTELYRQISAGEMAERMNAIREAIALIDGELHKRGAA